MVPSHSVYMRPALSRPATFEQVPDFGFAGAVKSPAWPSGIASAEAVQRIPSAWSSSRFLKRLPDGGVGEHFAGTNARTGLPFFILVNQARDAAVELPGSPTIEVAFREICPTFHFAKRTPRGLRTISTGVPSGR